MGDIRPVVLIFRYSPDYTSSHSLGSMLQALQVAMNEYIIEARTADASFPQKR